jgi:cytochrome bd-type quinol oxidase subunit 2
MKEYPILLRLSSFTGRAVVFFFAAAALLGFFFIVGNAQEFLDSTQRLLLSGLAGALALEVVCGLFLAVMLAQRSAAEHRPFVGRWVVLSLSIVVCLALLLALQWLRSWLRA